MNFTAVGWSFRTAPVALRERLAFDDAARDRALTELTARFSCEAVLLGTCNRVELYLATPPGTPRLDADLACEFVGECRGLPAAELRPHLYAHSDAAAVRHLFRVVASLDSLVVGEGQIAGQAKQAYERAVQLGAAGPFLNSLFQKARIVAKRVRSETGIARGNVSVSSVAVDFIRGVFDHFGDKTVLVIGAGKMGVLTLRLLGGLGLKRVLIANRSLPKAQSLAAECGGKAVPWEALDGAMAEADVILSTTGAPDVIVTRDRWRRVAARRSGGPAVIIDIAVPRDFDPAVHDGSTAFLYNVDDLRAVRDRTLAERRQHAGAAEAIVEHEVRKFAADWSRRRNGAVIARLTKDCNDKRDAIVRDVLGRLNGKLTDAERRHVEGAFRLFQNQLLHGPLSALNEAAPEEAGHTLLDAVRRLFRLQD